MNHVLLTVSKPIEIQNQACCVYTVTWDPNKSYSVHGPTRIGLGFPGYIIHEVGSENMVHITTDRFHELQKDSRVTIKG